MKGLVVIIIVLLLLVVVLLLLLVCCFVVVVFCLVFLKIKILSEGCCLPNNMLLGRGLPPLNPTGNICDRT